ncbi:MAG: hypothetical protein EA391_05415 [Balneolaceae bacterium]|nr:MAG: hypothetical protein EA391_05415 [Balneolaceae bacterium]
MKNRHFSLLAAAIILVFLLDGKVLAQNTFPSSGNVGIGTTSPTRPLHVVGDLRVTGNIRSGDTIVIDTGRRIRLANGTAGTPAFRFSDENGVGMFRAGTSDLRFSTGGSTRFQLTNSFARSYTRHRFHDGTVSSPGLHFASDTNTGIWRPGSNTIGFSTNGAERMRIDASGNVGIGTSNPTARLAVNGTTKTKEIIVTDQGSAWPDYVFSPDYLLLDLFELESYVTTNRRLPGMPSENEIAENGQNLGEIQIRLLEKVEELTLHIIQMKKESVYLNEQRLFLKEKIKKIKTDVYSGGRE